MAKIPSDVPLTQGQPGAFTSFFGPDPVNLLGVVLLTSLGTWGLPQMIGKFYAIKDEKSISTGTIISTIFAIIISGGCYFLGGFGRLFDSPEIYDKAGGAVVYDSIIPHMLSMLPDLLIGVVVVLVLSASMSTLSSQNKTVYTCNMSSRINSHCRHHCEKNNKQYNFNSHLFSLSLPFYPLDHFKA